MAQTGPHSRLKASFLHTLVTTLFSETFTHIVSISFENLWLLQIYQFYWSSYLHHGFDVWYLNIFHLYDARDARVNPCVLSQLLLDIGFSNHCFTVVPQIALSVNMNMDLYETVLGRKRRNGTDCLVGLQLRIICETAGKKNPGIEVKLNKVHHLNMWKKKEKRMHCFQMLSYQAYQYAKPLSKAHNRMNIFRSKAAIISYSFS